MKLSSCLVFLIAGSGLVRAESGSLSAGAKSAWKSVSDNVVRSAEKMPEENYSFRPTESVRSFGQLIGHLTDADYLFCAAIRPDKKTPPGAEKKLTSKADLVQALKDSVAYCDAAFEQLTDSQAAQTVKLFGSDRPKLSILYMNIAHANEHYGNIVTYLRLKDIVPPSSESRAALRLYFDRAHGEAPVPDPMAGIAKRLNLEITSVDKPISSAGLQGSRVLYLRAPSGAFAETEKAAIVRFIKGGGSLLLVLDEEKRQKLSVTGVNDMIAPFGLRLTLDTPYLPNPGAIAIAGEINRANREVPYDGGRSVEGGTPFAFQLDKDGKPGPPYAAWQKVAGGGRIVVLAEGMASLFLGSANGQRLSSVQFNGDMDRYWGKDSAIFIEEVVSWLVKAG